MPFRQVRFLCDEDDIPGFFFIVTACNPDGKDVSDEENTMADLALKEVIDELGFPAFRVTGGDFDFSHQEPGWGFQSDRDQARALAAQFRQLALFEVRDGKVLLLPTDASAGAGEDLGDWLLRLDDGRPACPYCLVRPMRYPCDHLLTTFDSWGGSWALEAGFQESIYDDLVKGGLVCDEPSEEEEKRWAGVIRKTFHAVADKVTGGELNQGPGFSSVMEFIWVTDWDAAYAKLSGLLASGGAGSDGVD